MAAWGWIAVTYGAYMMAMAAAGRARQRVLAIGAAMAFAVAAAGAATLDNLVAQIMAPGAVALAGYWLSGLFVGPPESRLEAWLLETDRQVFSRFSVDRALTALPGWALELLELSYALVYVVVMAGAGMMARGGHDAVRAYWTVVLPAGFICYAALPFLRCRPPRSLEPPGVIARRAPVMRRLNERIVRDGSIQANTIPSGHVAASLAAGLAVVSWQPVPGAVLIGCAGLIALAATLGRYHYAVDCALGAAVAVAVWLAV